jgi:hypothetical protein
MTDKVTKTRRKLHNKELHNPYSSPNAVRIVQSKVIWADRIDMHTKFWHKT